MLAQVDVCPSCGRIHPDSRIGSLLPKSGGECPLVVFGSMPVLTDSEDPHEARRDMSVELLGGGDLVAPPLPTATALATRKPSALTIPWPMPSHLEEYL